MAENNTKSIDYSELFEEFKPMTPEESKALSEYIVKNSSEVKKGIMQNNDKNSYAIKLKGESNG